MTPEQVGGLVRTVLLAGGMYVVGKGYIDNATMNSIVGALGTIAIALWSWHSNKPKAA